MRLDGFDLPIVTERLLLRRYIAADLPAYLARRGREDIYRYLYRPMPDPQELRERFEKGLNGVFAAEGDPLRLTVERRLDGAILGDIMLELISLPSQQAEIGYVFHPDYNGQGYATEAIRALISFGFTQIGFHRIFARLDPLNQGSVGVMERLGLRREAHLIQNEFFNGRWWDEVIYATLRAEWEARTL